ncbi:SRPBCC family protein [Streptomyces sp. TLI_185]|uniref:SRPBCC family protein n=1 Tax=Streptomyces sp. TLI_185 TaxID=2485151 RepID=UPI000F4F6DD2|nr:SRPBCC family protein [Streptomyces sp. TLI_185]RPF34986.1 polyketide cyclase/dehydrase/lipid transport protein [Streptomyces sp. TLI_185]
MFSTGPSPSHGRHARPLHARALRRRHPVVTAALTVSLAVAGVLAATVPPAQAAAPHGSTSGCGGRGVDAAALIRYESDIVIKAPLATVWKLQTDVERWPSWQPPVTTAERLDPGRLETGSQFRWTTPAPATPTTPATTLTITSTVQELRRHRCVLWSGPAIGAGLRIDEGVHLWTFQKVQGGVHVHTEETWTGPQVEADVPTATAALGAGLEAWLHDLKTTAEAHDEPQR